ncbi:outer membrane protein assembly factor BamB family protein [Couchioplanes azureus]|uniref:outer membrane protein assembly factor BamB family protein n=1 Tax=Couchioplanes caeruleus TaxID=56438 RepID=UPI0016709E23|nr:PQQ-binding-like beta-propeller repeat protein [Couchioplanes caeruleus]GGQ38976.1 hypothetical protein GCM10010166_01890 [Couchioplanes caeruleus subsp. azureus]
MSVIDLGLVTDERDSPAEPARRPLRPGDLRWMLAAVVAALCVLGLTGSARPDSHAPRQLWAVAFQSEGDSFAATSDLVYVLSGAKRKLTAYGARDGAVRWTDSTLGDTAWMPPVEAGVMLLPASVQEIATEEGHGLQPVLRESVALDAVTGRELWRHPGDATVAGDGRALLVEWNDDASRIQTLHMVGLRDGKPLWSRPGGGAESWTVGTPAGFAADRLATVGARGQIKVLDAATGRVVATAVVPWVSQSAQGESYSTISVEGRTLYVASVDQGEGTLAAYDTETMRRKWHIGERAPAGVYRCGSVLCVGGSDGLAGVDPQSGALRWRATGSPGGVPLRGGALLVTGDESGSRHFVIDTASGQRVGDLGTGTLVFNYSYRQEALYLLTPTSQPPGQVAVRKVEDTGRAVLRGVMAPPSDHNCQNAGKLIACVTTDGRLTVTDVG